MSTDAVVFHILAYAIAFLSLLRIGLWAYRRKIVLLQSQALIDLKSLNKDFADLSHRPTSVNKTFSRTVSSKAKFDNFNFEYYAAECMIEGKDDFIKVIENLNQQKRRYQEYVLRYESLRDLKLKTTSARRLRQDIFNKVEHRIFSHKKIKEYQPSLKFYFMVTYTSPKGKNHYEKHISWDLDAFQKGLSSAIETANKMSSETFQRNLERSKMTRTLRYKVLDRDGHRCKKCGRSPQDGIILHVDHINPISKGGKTNLGNLQTLCADCNLGKSNRYID